MGLLDKILSTKKKIEAKRDEALQRIEDASIRETWYEHVNNTNDVIRVIQLKNTIGSKIVYRNIRRIQNIENCVSFTPSGDERIFYDDREYIHNSDECVETVFKRTYRLVTDSSRVNQLEIRYQEVLRNYGTRYEAAKSSYGSQDIEASRDRLNRFLNRDATQGSNPSEPAMPERQNGAEETAPAFPHPVSGLLYTASIPDVKTFNGYGGTAEIPLSLIPKENKLETDTKEEPKQIIEEREKKLDNLDSI